MDSALIFQLLKKFLADSNIYKYVEVPQMALHNNFFRTKIIIKWIKLCNFAIIIVK